MKKFTIALLALIFTYSSSFADVPALFIEHLKNRVEVMTAGKPVLKNAFMKQNMLNEVWDIYVDEYDFEEDEEFNIQELDDNIDDVLDIYAHLLIEINLCDIIKKICENFKIDITQQKYLPENFGGTWRQASKIIVNCYYDSLMNNDNLSLTEYLGQYLTTVAESIINSENYSYENERFSIVERLDPVVRWLAPKFIATITAN